MTKCELKKKKQKKNLAPTMWALLSLTPLLFAGCLYTLFLLKCTDGKSYDFFFLNRVTWLYKRGDQSLCWFEWQLLFYCGYYVSQNTSFKTKWLWYDRPLNSFYNTLCPQMLSSSHTEMCYLYVWKGTNPSVSSSLSHLVQRSLRSSLLELLFLETESLPVTDKAEEILCIP